MVCVFLEDGGKVPELEDANGPVTSDVPLFLGCFGHWHGQLFISHRARS